MFREVRLSWLVIYVYSSSLILGFFVYSSGLVGDNFKHLSWIPWTATPHEEATWSSPWLNNSRKNASSFLLPTQSQTEEATWPSPRKKAPSFLLPTQSQTDNYNAISIPDTMPFRTLLLNRTSLLKTDWVTRLYNFLHTTNTSVSPHVNMMFSDYGHRQLVLNWITAALFKIQPPLHNILVVSLEQTLCNYLLAKRDLAITCVVVQMEQLFLSEYLPNNVSATSLAHWIIQMKVRLPILRLITHWGYDVGSYDSDAVLLRNPQILYNDKQNFHIISSAGTYPPELSEVWGMALCAGTLLLRASSALGETM